MNSAFAEWLDKLHALPFVGPSIRWMRLLLDACIQDRVFLWASALTYTTVLSIVPFLAVAFSVLKGFGFQNTDFIKDLLMQASAGREQVVEHIITYIDQTNVRTLGALGVGFLFLTVVSLISNIENSLNTVWGVTKGRSWARKVTDYLSTILIVPVLMVAAISLTATVNNNALVQNMLANELISVVYVLILKIVPYIIVWMVLLFLYLLLPSTRVRFVPALLGAVIGGTIWQLAQWAYIAFQIGAAKYNAIYGSFAQLPLFLIWVYMSWVIVLLGAEICFVIQNYKTLLSRSKYNNVDAEQSVRTAVLMLMLMAQRFLQGQGPMPEVILAQDTGAPITVARTVLGRLREAGLVGFVESDDAYVLLQAPEHVKLKTVIDCFAKTGGAALQLKKGAMIDTADAQLQKMEEAMVHCDCNKSLAALLSMAT